MDQHYKLTSFMSDDLFQLAVPDTLVLYMSIIDKYVDACGIMW